MVLLRGGLCKQNQTWFLVKNKFEAHLGILQAARVDIQGVDEAKSLKNCDIICCLLGAKTLGSTCGLIAETIGDNSASTVAESFWIRELEGGGVGAL
jgi:hypothetical protein